MNTEDPYLSPKLFMINTYIRDKNKTFISFYPLKDVGHIGKAIIYTKYKLGPWTEQKL